jgi:hypothetical protein
VVAGVPLANRSSLQPTPLPLQENRPNFQRVEDNAFYLHAKGGSASPKTMTDTAVFYVSKICFDKLPKWQAGRLCSPEFPLRQRR